MPSPSYSLTQRWCPRCEGTEQSHDGIDVETCQRGRSRRDRGFGSLAFRFRCRRLPIRDDVCQFGKATDNGELKFYPCNPPLMSPTAYFSVVGGKTGLSGWWIEPECPPIDFISQQDRRFLRTLKRCSGPKESKLTDDLLDDPNSNETVRNLVINYINLVIFQRNYLSRIIQYNT